jgi:hypothetical protein
MKYYTQSRKKRTTYMKKKRRRRRRRRRRKATWIGYILRRNCFLEHVIEVLVEGRIEVTGRRSIKRGQLLDDLNETTGYWRLKEEALHPWRVRFERGYEPL